MDPEVIASEPAACDSRALDWLAARPHLARVVRRPEDLPTVSIITPSFNQGRWIGQTLASIAAQTYPNVEHVVVDGGSTDETLEVLLAAPRIRWISEKDRGQADAINKGIRMSGGPILAYLNSDDLLTEDAVSIAVERFLLEPDLDFLYGDGDVIDEEGRVLWEWLSRPEDYRLLADYHFLWNDFTNYIMQQATFWRRRLHDRIGLFDEEFHYALDVEFWLRAGFSGARLRHVPQKLGLFRMIQGTKSLSSPTVFWPDHLELFRRYRGLGQMRPYVEQYLFEEMRRAGETLDGASRKYREILDGRWGSLPGKERRVLERLGSRARGPALLLLADDAWQNGDVGRSRRLLRDALRESPTSLTRPRSLLFLAKLATGPMAAGTRAAFSKAVSLYRGRRYQARYREKEKAARRGGAA